MNNITNKAKYIVVAIILVLVVIASIVFQIKRYSPKQKMNEAQVDQTQDINSSKDNESREPVTNDNPHTSTYYSDGTEDSNYSYIENSSVMQDFSSSLPYRAIITIGDEVNSFLKQKGITGTRVYISSIDEKKQDNEFIFILRTIDETLEFEAKYDILKCSWDINTIDNLNN